MRPTGLGMAHKRLVVLAAVILLSSITEAQQSCINTCTDSANVLTQLKSCSGCGTDDWACFCRCQQYMGALMSCVQENCSGDDVENNIVSFCSSQGVSISYSSGSVYIGTSTLSSPASSSTTPSTTSLAGNTGGGAFLSSAVAGSSAFSGSSFTSTDSSDISSYLATAVPASARTEPSNACFVNTPFSYYSTPTWYSTLPTQAQSYYSSVNQGNTAACTLSPAAAAAIASPHNHSGLSGGAIAGIVIGAILAALLLALLLWLCLRRRRRARRDAAAARARNYEPRNAPPETYGNEKGLVGAAEPLSSRTPYGHGRELASSATSRSNGRSSMAHSGSYPASHGTALLTSGGRSGPILQGYAGPDRAAEPTNGSLGPRTPFTGTGSAGNGAVAAAMVRGAANNGQNHPDWSHTTTTTTRTTIRPRPKNSVPTSSVPSSRPPPQPIHNEAVENLHSQSVSPRPAGRRVF